MSYRHNFLVSSRLLDKVDFHYLHLSPIIFQMIVKSTCTVYLYTVHVFKGRFLEFLRYHNFANLSSNLSESIFYKETSKFQ